MPTARRLAIAFFLAALIGSVCGSLLIMGRDLDEAIGNLPGFAFLVGMIAVWGLPYVIAGLAAVGLPLTWLLRSHVDRLWMAPVFALCGWAAGSLLYFLYDRVKWGGTNELSDLTGFADLGPVFGIPTALAWWWLCRRLATREPLPA